MRRRLVTLLTALSLLLCAGSLVLWVRSYRFTEDFRVDSGRPGGRLFVSVSFVAGVAHAGYGRDTFNDPNEVLLRKGTMEFWHNVDPRVFPTRADTFWERRGIFLFRWSGATEAYTVRGVTVALPAWLVVLMFAIVPARCLVRRLGTSRRVARGLCLTCGYDLRATPGRCPECGAENRAIIAN